MLRFGGLAGALATRGRQIIRRLGGGAEPAGPLTGGTTSWALSIPEQELDLRQRFPGGTLPITYTIIGQTVVPPLVLTGDTLTADPNAGTGTITIQATDATAATVQQVVEFTNALPLPVMTADSLAMEAGATLVFDPTLNDASGDESNDAITLISFSVTSGSARLASSSMAGNEITLTAAAGATSGPIALTYTVENAWGRQATGTASAALAGTASQPPAAFVAGTWDAVADPDTSGDAILFTLDPGSIPASDEPLIAIEAVDAGANVYTLGGTAPGSYRVTAFTPNQLYDLRLRARSAAGPGALSPDTIGVRPTSTLWIEPTETGFRIGAPYGAIFDPLQVTESGAHDGTFGPLATLDTATGPAEVISAAIAHTDGDKIAEVTRFPVRLTNEARGTVTVTADWFWGEVAQGTNGGPTHDYSLAPDGTLVTYRETATDAQGGVLVSTSNGITVAAVAADTTPDAFTFTDQDNVALSTLDVTSNQITVAGINAPALAEVFGHSTREFQVYAADGTTVVRAWNAAPVEVTAGQKIAVRLDAPTQNDAFRTVVLRIGGATEDTFKVSSPVTGAVAVDYMMPGAVQHDSAVVSIRTVSDATVDAVWSTDPAFGTSTTATGGATETVTKVRKVALTGLPANSTVYYRARINGVTDTATTKSFKTPPALGTAFDFSFAFGSCGETLNSTPTYARILARNPLFFLTLGDTPYADLIVNDEAVLLADDLPWLKQPGVVSLLGSAWFVKTWDDHDWGADDDGSSAASAPARKSLYRKLYPHYPLAQPATDQAIYHSFGMGRVLFAILDTRAERYASPQTFISATQMAWLKTQMDRVHSGEFRYLIIGQSLPFIGAIWPSGQKLEINDYVTARAGLRHRILMCSGDMHGLAFDDGTNNLDSAGNPSFPVMHAAPFNRANSTKGGPYTHGPFSAGNHQYGLPVITDTGSAITVNCRGYGYDAGTATADALLIDQSWTVNDPVADTTAPVLSGVSTTASSTTATTSFSISEPATWRSLLNSVASYADYDAFLTAWNAAPSDGKKATGSATDSGAQPDISHTGLIASTPYNRHLAAIDAAGNKSIVSSAAFTTGAGGSSYTVGDLATTDSTAYLNAAQAIGQQTHATWWGTFTRPSWATNIQLIDFLTAIMGVTSRVNGALRLSGTDAEGHTEDVTQTQESTPAAGELVAFIGTQEPDGTGGTNQRISIWDAGTGWHPSIQLDASATVNNLAFQNAGDLRIGAGGPMSIVRLGLHTGQALTIDATAQAAVLAADPTVLQALLTTGTRQLDHYGGTTAANDAFNDGALTLAKTGTFT